MIDMVRRRSKQATSPRKVPRQQRSQALVEAILEATARVLPERGAEHTTTNRIANVAGVSVGSLYQYFPNRDAILAWLFDRGLEHEAQTLIQVLDDMADRPLHELVETIVERFSELYLQRPRLLRTLVAEAPRLGRVRHVVEVRMQVADAIARAMRQRPAEIAPTDPERAAFVLINSVMGVYEAWVLSEPAERIPREAVNEHLTRLILSYLRGSESS